MRVKKNNCIRHEQTTHFFTDAKIECLRQPHDPCDSLSFIFSSALVLLGRGVRSYIFCSPSIVQQICFLILIIRLLTASTDFTQTPKAIKVALISFTTRDTFVYTNNLQARIVFRTSRSY